MRCDTAISTAVAPAATVSIPIGFSNALRLAVSRDPLRIGTSFNPYWVFQCAATMWLRLYTQPIYEVSIPIGFSNALRRCCCCLVRSNCQVSIPIGFSNALRHTHRYEARDSRRRVSIPIGFSNALRQYWIYNTRYFTQFQSLLGFPMRCD